jgi:hypothetical protein
MKKILVCFIFGAAIGIQILLIWNFIRIFKEGGQWPGNPSVRMHNRNRVWYQDMVDICGKEGNVIEVYTEPGEVPYPLWRCKDY